jgi:hypothetical protein
MSKDLPRGTRVEPTEFFSEAFPKRRVPSTGIILNANQRIADSYLVLWDNRATPYTVARRCFRVINEE